MARSRSRGASRRPTKATSRKSKEPKKAKDKAKATAGVEIVEEGKGMNIDDGVVIATTLIFLAALVMIDRELGLHYGAGLLFK